MRDLPAFYVLGNFVAFGTSCYYFQYVIESSDKTYDFLHSVEVALKKSFLRKFNNSCTCPCILRIRVRGSILESVVTFFIPLLTLRFGIQILHVL